MREKVRAVPMRELFATFGWERIGLFCLDVEGAELHVLRTIDFRAVRIDAFLIEVGVELIERGDAAKIDVLLRTQGYRKLRTPPFTPGDVVYLRSALYNVFVRAHPREGLAESEARA